MLVSSEKISGSQVNKKTNLGIAPICKDGGEFFVLKWHIDMWIILSLLASFFWGLLYVLRGQIYSKISIYTSISISAFFVFVVALIISLSSGNFHKDIVAIASSKQLLLYVISAMAILLLAEIFIASSIVAKNATLAGLIEVSYPIFIALFSYILYKNQVSLQTIIGGACIFIGIFIVYYFNK
jgi:drug/metabolite transporter (DMT)-like permease